MRNLTRLTANLKQFQQVKHFSTENNLVKADICIVGGGIVGLASARELINRFPNMSFVLVEKEQELSKHQSGHNSGVIHAGIYYAPGSLKAKLCLEGLKKSYEYLEKTKIPYKKCGKLIVAVEEYELPTLDNLMERAKANGVPGVRIVNADEIRQLEPHCVGLKAIYSPETGIVDWRQVALSFAEDFKKANGKIYTDYKVNSFKESSDPKHPVEIRADGSNMVIQARHVITCAGLYSDKIAELSGAAKVPKIVPFRGDYLLMKPEKSDLVKMNIYPVPNPKFPFLGVHFTPRVDGSIWLGPNAVLSFKREGYGRFDFSIKDTIDALGYSGVRKIALRNLSFGVKEFMNGIFTSMTVKSLQRYVPSLQTSDVIRGPSGVRAQALDPEGNLVDDFIFHNGEGEFGKRLLHVRNAPSPAATSSLAIARMIADKSTNEFGLTNN
ncbi:L-2-hydroxyglutarate dehydrogenase, mitochondrial [Cichlidogyrus casuarinus]|uniref:L-2-hydroxyglutarate dehydrogenase, mitochondrial n=1 Tax=Cichlidogyrus casuarinus TaxID=1844966 RepID=A0ABD2PU09_9PLAT